MRPTDRPTARIFRAPASRTPIPTSDDSIVPRRSAGGRAADRRPRLHRSRVESKVSVATSVLSATYSITAATFVATAAYGWMVVTAATAAPVLGLAWGWTGTSRGFRGL
jgi:hypothetical protein